MSDTNLVDRIGDWLMDQALADSSIVATFEELCARLQAIGVPLSRARLTWPTLHPLFRAETVLWKAEQPIEFQQFDHQDAESDAWRRSPVKWMLDHNVTVLRRRLTGPDPLLDFELLSELVEEGYTDFLAVRTAISQARDADGSDRFGVYVTWCSSRRRGFSDDDIEALQRLQRSFAVACKAALQPRIMRNIVNTYLGPTVASAVLAGQIKLGSGTRTQALIWYSDLRGSTRFSETLDEAGYLELINAYFGCVAHAAIEAGGEVLAFIGDAVLAIFPISAEASGPGFAEAVAAVSRAGTSAARQAREALAVLNAARVAAGLAEIEFGIAMNIGEVMFGNIGIARRLSFSVIGPSVNEVARIEKMTKTLRTPVLATKPVADAEPGAWKAAGAHCMAGLIEPMELYALSV